MWHVFLLIIFIVNLRREVRKITFGYLPAKGLVPIYGISKGLLGNLPGSVQCGCNEGWVESR
jgi:hypothetical protein